MMAIIKAAFEVLAIIWVAAIASLVTLKRLLVPKPPKSLQNEVILVTGGSNGIGRSILLRIAALELDVTLISWDIDSASNEATIKELLSLGVKRAVAMTVDVKNKNEVSAAAARVRREYGDVTILFNNAGIVGPVGRCWETDIRHQEMTIQVNLVSHFYTLREFLPGMVQKNRGHVVATCSAAGFTYLPDAAPYFASKHAVSGYYQCLKEDLRNAASKVSVSLVYPSIVKTNLTAPYKYTYNTSFAIQPEAPSASSAGQQIVDGVIHNKENIYVPWYFHLLHSTFGMISSEVLSSILDFVGAKNWSRTS